MKGILSNIAAYLCLALSLVCLYGVFFKGAVLHTITASLFFFMYIGFRESAEEDKEVEE